MLRTCFPKAKTRQTIRKKEMHLAGYHKPLSTRGRSKKARSSHRDTSIRSASQTPDEAARAGMRME